VPIGAGPVKVLLTSFEACQFDEVFCADEKSTFVLLSTPEPSACRVRPTAERAIGDITSLKHISQRSSERCCRQKYS
jgi:hypothetical protein